MMVEISATMVKELRDETGAAMMDCKKALVEAGGDREKARELLRQKGLAAAGKKAARAASEGLVVSKVSKDGKTGVMVEVNCETDFVARNEEFVALCSEIAELALATRSKDAATLLAQKHGSGTLADLVTAKVAKTGENIIVRRAALLEEQGPGCIAAYVHALGGKMGAMVALSTSSQSRLEELQPVGRDVAMHIVSAKPQYLNRKEIPPETIENERRIESGKEDLAKKPPEMREKIVSGRVDKIMAERCLVDQPFVKDQGQTVGQFLKTKGQALGAEITPVKFALFILGEVQEDPPHHSCTCSH